MRYQLRFTVGELAGQVFPVGSETLSIGRSRSTTIRLMAADVSGRHLLIRLDSEGVSLENLSAHITRVEGRNLTLGDRVRLTAGETVRLGAANAFELQSLADTPEQPAAANVPTMAGEDVTLAEETTVASPSAASPQVSPAVMSLPPSESEKDSDQTIAMQTRMVSPEELEVLKQSYQRRRSKRILIGSAIVAALIGGLVFAYWTLIYREPERYISWPVDKTGEPIINLVKFEGIPFAKSMDLEYPSLPQARVEQSEGRLEIRSFLGKYWDVPLRLVVEYTRDVQTLHEDRDVTLKRWMTEKATGTEAWNFGLVLPLGFFSKGHGVPYLIVPYSRTVNGESWYGFAVQIRYEEWVIYLVKEVPMRERWRSEAFLQGYDFIWFAPAIAASHWEGSGAPWVKACDVRKTLDEARVLLKRRSPTVWEQTETLLRAALITIRSSGGDAYAEEFKAAKDMLSTLREKQSEWFNAQRVAYLRAKNLKADKERTRITDGLKAVFSSDEDLRYYKIRQNKWD